MNDLYGVMGIVEGIVGLISGLGIMLPIMAVVVTLLTYEITGYMIMCVGRKAGLTEDWMAYLLIARQLYQMQIAGRPWWYIFFFQGCLVNIVVTAALLIIFGALFKSVPLTVLVVLLWEIASLVFTFLYYRSYYPLFGFNPNTAWLEIVWTFGTAGTILLIIMAFSDTIQYRAGGGPVKSASMPVISEGGNRDNTQKKDYTQMEGRTVAGTRAEISGVDGKYAGASFDVSDGAEVVFGRSAADSNIVFDQFDTDISRKHCTVRYDRAAGDYVVTDSSTNGTYLNGGKQLPSGKPVHVARGSVIYLGKSRKNSFRLG